MEEKNERTVKRKETSWPEYGRGHSPTNPMGQHS